MNILLSLFHIFLVVPLLLFIGFHRADTPRWVYYALASIGFVVLLYHGFRLFTRLSSPYVWVNVIHLLFIAPLLLFIGYHQKDTPRFAYELILILAFGALGYHLFSLVKLTQTVDSLAM